MNLLFLRTQRRRLVGMVVLTLVVAFLAIPALSHTASAATAAPTIDPIVGDWSAKYRETQAVVTMSRSGGSYTETAKSPFQFSGSSCILPPGTILATFSGSGNMYSGQHGLWHTGDCSFGIWDPMSLTLSSDGKTLTGILDGGYGTVIFTKVVRVVVMGDSYASGEGTYNNGNRGNPPSFGYYSATATKNDRCHRSPGAYAPLLGVDVGFQDSTNDGNFVACSGSTTAQIISGAYGEPSQLSILDSSVGVVIISAGGDDANFSGVLTTCTNIPAFQGHKPLECKKTVDDSRRNFPTISKHLGSLYNTIESRTNGAHLIVVGYPRIYPAGGSDGCNWISADKQRYINSATDELDRMISRTASEHNATFVDTRPLFAGHEVCGASTGIPYINDLQLNKFLAHNCPDVQLVPDTSVCSQSYHPNSTAYAAEAKLLQTYIY